MTVANRTIGGMAGRELVDILSSTGAYKGVMRRSSAHAALEWHRTFHCWVVAERAHGPVLLCQRRHRSKNRPGLLDAAAGGHFTAGESDREAAREIEEELGVAVAFESLTSLGVFPISHGQGGCDNEFAHLYSFRDDRPLREWGFDRHEAEGLLEVPAGALAVSMETGSPLLAVELSGGVVRTSTVTFDSFSPFSNPYWAALLAFAQSSVRRTSA